MENIKVVGPVFLRRLCHAWPLSEQTAGVAYAAHVRGSRPLGHEYSVSRLTNEARTSLNHLRIMGFGSCLLTRGIQQFASRTEF